MRVCVLGRGNYEQLSSRTKQIASHGVDLHVLSFQPGEMEHATVHTIPKLVGGLSYLTLPIAARRLIRRLNPQVIDVHGVSSYGAYCFGPVAGIPTVATVYGSDITAHAAHSSVGRIIAKRCLHQADLVYASSDVALNDAKQILGVDFEDRFVHRSWGIEIHKVQCLGVPERQAERLALGIPEDAVVALHNRQFCDFWRIDKVLEVALQFCQAPSCYFLFVCPTGDAAVESKISEAQSRVKRAGLEKQIRFLKALPHDQMLRVFNAADIFTCFGDADLLSSSILEAMALGLIPILRDLPAYREVLTNNHSGFLYDDLDVPTVVARFREVAGSLDQHRQKIGDPNRKLIAGNYNASSCSQWMVNRYQELIENPR